MAPNKTISLDEHTAKIADRLPNFSRFVRQCLLQHVREATVDEHVAPLSARIWGETKDKCNPMNTKGVCVLCWGSE
jgi:hypothetical protein